MGTIRFEDYSFEVKNALRESIIDFLYTAARSVHRKATIYSPSDTGQLEGSWDYKIDESKQEAVIGSPLQNAIWNEFGTGQYALHGDGRKTPWKYQDIKGKWHTTTGKRPQRTLHNAFESKKGQFKAMLEETVREKIR